MHAWANRILRIDLSDMSVRAEPSEPYLPDWIGGRGLAVKLCWDANGRPTKEGLAQVGLTEIYGPMMTGATRSKEETR